MDLRDATNATISRALCTDFKYLKNCPGAETAYVICVASRADQWGSYKEAEFGHNAYTQKRTFAYLEPVSNGKGCLGRK